MFLQTLWFILIAVVFVMFFFLEGFDYGVGILLPFVGKTDAERRVVINTIGPFWDGNEVWMILAGGAIFAAFPHWYATLFSGFYLALFLLLLALIVRGVAFEFRSKLESEGWRRFWDWMLFLGSAIPALLWGVALVNLVRGVPIDAHMQYVGGFFTLLNPYALLGGLTVFFLFTLHGALFLNVRTAGAIQERVRALIPKLWGLEVILFILFVLASFVATPIASKPLGLAAGILALLFLILVKFADGVKAFVWGALAVVFTVITLFATLYPNVMVSSLNPEWSLTIYNASSSQYTLSVMTIVAVLLVPVALIYNVWTYKVFSERLDVSKVEQLEY